MSGPGSVSVVIAVGGGLRSAPGCAEAFRQQLDAGRGDEVIVQTGEARDLVPQLWARGIEKSSGEIVALTVGSMLPAAGWADTVRREMERPIAGVGGAIEPAAGLDASGWAVHLCRYSAYLQPFEARESDGLPGDNAAYRRSELERCREAWSEGFWETEVDPLLRGNGGVLRITPDLEVRQVAGAGFAAFCMNRLRHGARSGRERAFALSFGGRLLRALAFPAVPFVLLQRIAGRARPRGHGRAFVRALPLLTVFLCSWAAGEAAGLLRGKL